MFPFAFRTLDFAVFWCHNATQSGRMENRISMKWNGYGLKQVEFSYPHTEILHRPKGNSTM
jgi:hypothetical protein